jgi:uncharacterized protein (TIGR00369 family)
MTVDEIVKGMPYARFLGIFPREDDDGLLTCMAFREELIGNHRLPAIHGGVVGAFLEMAAILEVIHETSGERIPRPINFNVNYLRTARPLDCIARAEVVKLGKRIAHVRAVAWQDDPSRTFAEGYGNFLV